MRSLISIDFPAPKMEPESAHAVSAVSVHWLQCIAMQHDPGNIQQGKSFSSWLATATLSP